MTMKRRRAARRDATASSSAVPCTRAMLSTPRRARNRRSASVMEGSSREARAKALLQQLADGKGPGYQAVDWAAEPSEWETRQPREELQLGLHNFADGMHSPAASSHSPPLRKIQSTSRGILGILPGAPVQTPHDANAQARASLLLQLAKGWVPTSELSSKRGPHRYEDCSTSAAVERLPYSPPFSLHLPRALSELRGCAAESALHVAHRPAAPRAARSTRQPATSTRTDQHVMDWRAVSHDESHPNGGSADHHASCAGADIRTRRSILGHASGLDARAQTRSAGAAWPRTAATPEQKSRAAHLEARVEWHCSGASAAFAQRPAKGNKSPAGIRRPAFVLVDGRTQPETGRGRPATAPARENKDVAQKTGRPAKPALALNQLENTLLDMPLRGAQSAAALFPSKSTVIMRKGGGFKRTSGPWSWPSSDGLPSTLGLETSGTPAQSPLMAKSSLSVPVNARWRHTVPQQAYVRATRRERIDLNKSLGKHAALAMGPVACNLTI